MDWFAGETAICVSFVWDDAPQPHKMEIHESAQNAVNARTNFECLIRVAGVQEGRAICWKTNISVQSSVLHPAD